METQRPDNATDPRHDAPSEDPSLSAADFRSSQLFQKMLDEAGQWERDFVEFKEEYTALRDRDDQYVGRFLTCHLLIEHHLAEFLEAAHPAIPRLGEQRLTFAQKMELATHPKTNVYAFMPAISA